MYYRNLPCVGCQEWQPSGLTTWCSDGEVGGKDTWCSFEYVGGHDDGGLLGRRGCDDVKYLLLECITVCHVVIGVYLFINCQCCAYKESINEWN